MSRFRPPTSGVGTLSPYRSRVKAGGTGVAVLPPNRNYSPVPQPPTQAIPVRVSPIGGFLTTLMGLYVFMHVIPWAEIMDTIIGINLRMTLVTGILVSFGVLFSGQIARFWALPIAKTWMLMLALFLLASVTGGYPRGSLTFMGGYATRFHIFPFLICAVAQTGTQVKRMMYWGGCGGLVAILLTFLYGQSLEGRLEIPDTSLGNPNDLALTLLLGGLFLMTMLYSSSVFVRLIPIATVPLALYYIMETGSRANFLTVGVAAISVFLSAPAKVKGKVLVGIPIVIAAMIMLVPSSTITRLTTIFANPTKVINARGEFDSAIASQIARTQLQERAISLTLQHPLLGVGPQEFAVAIEAVVREETGRKSSWQNAHNVYLQIAAENGIPAFLCFVITMVWGIRTNYRVYKQCSKHPVVAHYEGQSFCLLILTAAYSFGIAFGNYMYDPGFPILIGLTAANQMAFLADLQLGQGSLQTAPATPRV